MDANFFLCLAAPILARDDDPAGKSAEQHFKYFFGVSVAVVDVAWNLMRAHEVLPDDAKPIHLLWACFFLRHYTKETVLEVILGRTMKTVRLHMWPIIAALGHLTSVLVSLLTAADTVVVVRFFFPSSHIISGLSLFSMLQVKLEDRYNNDWQFMATLYVDCIDFMIEEPDARDKWWYSHKSNGPGLRYELATSIQTGLISWASGPWRAGLWHEKEIFKNGLYLELDEGEPVHTDRGYSGTVDEDGGVVFITPNTQGLEGDARRAHGQLHGRHEGVNGKLKRFSVLENRFRHDLDRHGECFFAVVALVQLEMMVETTPYHVEYAE